MPTTTKSKHSFPVIRDELKTAMLAGYPEHIERLGWDRARITAHQQEQLRSLLTYAAERSPFHARRLRGLDLASVHPGDLSSLPVMTKSEMMGELDDVFTDRRLTRGVVERSLAEADPEPATPLGEYIALTSGGSSGQRGVFVHDHPAAVQFFSSLSRGLVSRLEAMGGPPPGGLRIAMVSAGSPVHATGIAGPLGEGEVRLPFQFVKVPVTLPLPVIVDELNALQLPALYGYPSMLARLARERNAGRLRVSPMVVTSTSEPCTPELRAAISAGFGVPLIDTFGSTEGLVGASAPDDDVITFADDGCIIELVDENHRLVAPGTPSASVLITSLSNRVQPLIRYELTDSMTQQPAVPEHGHLRARVHGRADDAFTFGDVVIHPLVIRSVLVRSGEVLEYQVCQTPTGIAVTAVTEPRVELAQLQLDLQTALTGAGLVDAEVAVHSAQGLDRDPATGKLRRFVPLSGTE